MKKKRSGTKIRLAAGICAIALWLCGGAEAAEVKAEIRNEYHPVVFAYMWEEADSPVACLLGAFGGGKWYGHTDLPILVNGRPITPEEGMALSDSVACSTPLLEKGKKLTFYAADGRKVEGVSVEETKYSCSAASTEVFIDVVAKGLKIPARVMYAGVDGGADGERNALAAPTERGKDGERITFVSTDEVLGKMSAVFTPAFDEYGEKVYRGTIAFGGKSWPLTDAYGDSQDTLDGMFIDLNGDGRTEFLLYSSGVAGFIAAFELNDAGAKEVLILDLGD